jgi:hypothetical protein
MQHGVGLAQSDGQSPAQNDGGGLALEVEGRGGLGELPGREREEERAVEGGAEEPFGGTGEAKERASERVREREVGEWDCGGSGAGEGGEGEEGFGCFGVFD